MNFLLANTTNHRRVIMFVATALFGVFTTMVFYKQPLTLREFIFPPVAGLFVFEFLFRTRTYLKPITLPLYIIIVIIVRKILYDILYLASYGYPWSPFDAFQHLYAIPIYSYGLYALIDSSIVMGLAYYLIKGYRIESWSIPEPESIPADATGWRVFLARYQQQIMGFVGWYLVSWALVSPLGLNLFFLNIITLIVLALIKGTRRVAGGILIALALNFTISLILGLGLNALCFIPFFTPISSPF